MPIGNPKHKLTFYKPDFEAGTALPFIPDGVKAGFPSPALDFMEYEIDLNRHLARNPVATFYIRVDGDSMRDAGIFHGDMLVVDRSLEPADGKIAVCLVDGEFTVKRLKLQDNCLYLMPENPEFPPLLVTENNAFSVWGVVTYVVREV